MGPADGALPSAAAADREREERRREIGALRLRFAVSLGRALPLLYLAMGGHAGLALPAWSGGAMALAQFVLTTPILAANRDFYVRGLLAVVRTRAATMDTLVALGTGAAWLYSLAARLPGDTPRNRGRTAGWENLEYPSDSLITVEKSRRPIELEKLDIRGE